MEAEVNQLCGAKHKPSESEYSRAVVKEEASISMANARALNGLECEHQRERFSLKHTKQRQLNETYSMK